MLLILVVSLLVSSMLALTAFLQSEAPWWKGPAAATILLFLGFIVLVATSYQDDFNSEQPVLYLSVGAWICASIVFTGSSIALLLRRFFSPAKITKLVFVGGSTLIFLVLLVANLT